MSNAPTWQVIGMVRYLIGLYHFHFGVLAK